MTSKARNAARFAALTMISAASAIVAFGGTSAQAGEAEAKDLLKGMSTFLAGQKAISFNYDSDLEVVTTEHQKLMLASSGKVEIGRPDKLRATRSGGFADVEVLFDGKLLTVLGKDANLYAQVKVPGTIDNLISELRDKLQRPIPGADLLSPDVYSELMADVTDVKDLGSGVIGGTECDHLAFRAKEVDWQIWIAQGSKPYPCRYVITAKDIDQGPQYSITISDWKTGIEVTAEDFGFQNKTAAEKVDIAKLGDTDELPSHFAIGAAK